MTSTLPNSPSSDFDGIGNLWRLHDATWKEFSRRVEKEWKFSAVCWTALLGLIALALQGKIGSDLDFLTLAPFAFVAFHLWWEYNMARSNNTDLAKCRDIQFKIVTLLSVHMSFQWSPATAKRIEKMATRQWLARNWSHIGQVGVTAVLALVAIALLLHG